MNKIINVKEVNKNNEIVKERGNKKFDNFIELTLWMKSNGFTKQENGTKMMSFFKIMKKRKHIIRFCYKIIRNPPCEGLTEIVTRY